MTVGRHTASLAMRPLLLLCLCAALMLLGLAAARAQEAPTAVADYPQFGVVTAAVALNVRSCAARECEVIYTVPNGESLRVTGPAQNGWLPISRDGAPGWAFHYFVQIGGAPAPVFERGLPGCKRVAFLFNLGVGYTTRTEVLDWMSAHAVPATMFPMGWWAETDPDALRKMHALGFPIASHGDQRTELTKLGDEAISADIRAAADAIRAVIGEPPAPMFTPYAAATDPRVEQIIANEGYLPVGWDVPADDWDFNVTADHVFTKVMPNIEDGSIVEFHLDAPATKESTAVALPWIVERLRKDGYTIVPLTDLMMPCPAGKPASAPSPVPTSVNG